MTTTAEPTSSAAPTTETGSIDSLPLTPRARSWAGNIAFALLCYVPLLVMHPGKVEADTKSYLYLDVGRFLAGASSMWDPHIGMGTVSHQTLGYLFPVGPFYWFLQEGLNLPAWVAQRLWLGTLLCAAGFGVRYLLHTLSVRGPGVAVGMLAFTFTPYVLEYSARLSVLLGPWSALPWLTAFTILALRYRNWKYPALFALTIQLVSSINASALIFAMVGPALWFVYAVFVLRESTLRRAIGVGARIAILTILTSLWWMMGLSIQGQYGLNVLRFTESLEVVSATAYPFELLRGLGYWFFYGRDRTGHWNAAMTTFTQSPGSLFVSFLVPTLALAAAAIVRWRHRTFFVLLVLFGLTIGVAAAPYDSPSPLGTVFKSFALSSTAGFALRSTARAVPLLVLGFAVFLAVGVNAVGDRLRARGSRYSPAVVAAALAVVCLVNAPGLFSGIYYSKYLERDEKLPEYWTTALAELDAKSHATRVLALPGADFAAYRWGDTIDPIEPGLMDRHYVARELVPWGSEPAANVLQAVDRRLQEGAFESESLAPMVRLMGVGDVLLRMDLQTDRFALIPSHQLWQLFTQNEIEGLGAPTSYGTEIPGRLIQPEIENPSQPTTEDPPPVAVFPVDDPLPIVRAKEGVPLIVDGDGEGLVDVSAAGLLDARRPVLYAATYQQDPDRLRALGTDGILVLTDSNRRRALRWSGIVSNYGYTETAGEEPVAEDRSDQRLDVFPGSDDDARTVAVLRGVKAVRATEYGTNTFGYSPGERPAAAFDGDPDTGWFADGGVDIKHQRLRVDLDGPITTDHVNLSQPSGNERTRYISDITLTFDGKERVKGKLDPSSRTEAGQTVKFPRRTFSTLEITVDNVKQRTGLALITRNPVGFNEVRLRDDAPGSADIRIDETMRLPRDMLSTFGEQSLQHPLAIVLTRESTMDQVAMNRAFELPTAREFTFAATGNIGIRADDALIDVGLGSDGAATANANERLGDPRARASAAIDGDPSTAWNSPINEIRRPVFTITTAGSKPVTFDHLDLQLVADNRHSRPTSIEIVADDGSKRTVKLPKIADDVGGDGVASVPVEFEPLTGSRFTIRFPTTIQVRRSDLTMPLGVAEFGIPGVQRAAVPTDIPDVCQRDLITIDGKPYPVRITGTSAEALRGHKLAVTPCDDAPLVLAAGPHEIRVATTPRNQNAFDVSRITLTSAAGGDAVALDGIGEAASEPLPLTIDDEDRTELTAQVTPTSTEPFWLVLGQSINKGWTAKADGKDLGAPQLIDGYANGWRITPSETGKPIAVTIEWTPQRRVLSAIVISALAVLACLVILVVAAIRRRRSPDPAAVDAYDDPAPTLRPPPWTETLAPRRRAIVIAVVGIGLLGALVVQPLVGLVVAGIVYLAVRRPKWRTVLIATPAAIMAAITLYITLGQVIEKYPPRFDWPTFFKLASIPAWIAVLLLVADALISTLWRLDAEPATPQENDDADG